MGLLEGSLSLRVGIGDDAIFDRAVTRCLRRPARFKMKYIVRGHFLLLTLDYREQIDAGIDKN